jgi:hypothetical protein
MTGPLVVAFLIFAVFMVVGLKLLYAELQELGPNRGEEPFAFFEGISIWPTNLVRVLALLFGISFVLRTQQQLVGLKLHVAARFGLDRLDRWCCRPPPWTWARLRLGRISEIFWLRHERDAKPRPGGSPPGHSHQEPALWREYCRVTSHPVRFPRVILCLLLYLGASMTLGMILGLPLVPARGPWSRALDTGIMVATVIMYTYLLFFVLDITVLAAELIERLMAYIGRRSYLREYEAIHLVSDLAGTVSRLIYLPFSVLFMLMASRNALFDRWDWPASLVVTFLSGLALIVLATLKFQGAAQAAQRRAIEDADKKLIIVKTALTYHPTSLDAAYKGPRTKTDDLPPEIRDRLSHASPEGLERWVDELAEQKRQIKEFDDAAFQSWHQNPIFRALLIPLGGLGSLQLLEKLLTGFGS